MRPEEREKVLFLYRDAKRMVQKAEADPDQRGIEHARESLRHAETLMRNYGIGDDA